MLMLLKHTKTLARSCWEIWALTDAQETNTTNSICYRSNIVLADSDSQPLPPRPTLLLILRDKADDSDCGIFLADLEFARHHVVISKVTTTATGMGK
ncbi:hypothetical protein BaRGS_00002260 [Batillaria attramentaria]|uniref:Uncharacterized protein n=1 Tax=Batillaria attramentaria TaxID=370345 RepID=A0ABD0M534_9CAEN